MKKLNKMEKRKELRRILLMYFNNKIPTQPLFNHSKSKEEILEDLKSNINELIKNV